MPGSIRSSTAPVRERLPAARTSHIRTTSRLLRAAAPTLAGCLVTAATPAWAEDVCSNPIGHVVSVEGTVAVARAGVKDGVRARGRETPVCDGDTVITGARSRAAVRVRPGNTFRVDQGTRLRIRSSDGDTEIDLDRAGDEDGASGAGAYFMTRFPKRFKVKTRLVHATVEGTEFVVHIAPRATRVSVLEGRVLGEDPTGGTGAAPVAAGQALQADDRTTTTIEVNPVDAVQWAIHYPRLTDAGTAEACAAAPGPALPTACAIGRAEDALASGNVGAALALLDAVDGTAAGTADVLALRSIIHTARGERAAALETATRAVQADPRSVRARTALGYAHQGAGDLVGARDSAVTAVRLGPDDAIARSRLAELLLALGETREAEHEARRAVEAGPANARARVVLGYVLLARGEIEQAASAFGESADLDPSQPLARLGLGLALVRQGHLVAGREQMEVAVALDPANALLRAYLGKAYFDERTPARVALAGEQFALAKTLDPNDPTPWFYDALRRQATNDPGAALRDLDAAQARNDGRAVYRSRLLLDEDAAARTASQARIYQDLGFDQLARSTAARSLAADPDNFAAHRFLAEAYATQPRQEIARVSELLQSQLRQPVGAAPLLTQQTEANLLVPEAGGPLTPGFNEFNPLFMRDRTTLSIAGLAGGQATRGSEVSAGWLRGPTALSVGAYHLDTDGFRPNAGLRQEIYRVFGQRDVSAQTSLQAEFRATRLDHGDVTLRFDPNAFSRAYRRSLDTNQLRLGLRHDFGNRSDIVASVIVQRRDETLFDPSIDTSDPLFPALVELANRRATDSGTGELQYTRHFASFALKTGAGIYLDRTHENERFTVTDITFGFPLLDLDTNTTPRILHRNAYAYAFVPVGEALDVTAGISLDHFERSAQFARNRVNPKLGVMYSPRPGTTLRASALRGMKRALAGNQTIEPTLVSGFSQFFDDANGTAFTRYGVGLDQTFGGSVFAGLELSARALSVPELRNGTLVFNPWRERLHRAYLSWLASRRLTVGIEHYHEAQSREVPDDVTDQTFPREIVTQLTPVTATWHGPQGWFARARASRVRQSVRFPLAGPGDGGGADAFWLADVEFGYRFTRYRATVSLQALNVFGREFRYQNTDLVGAPRSPLFAPVRTLLARLSLAL